MNLRQETVSHHRSPSLTAIYNSIRSKNNNQILDLGCCLSGNLRFFSELGCRFHFAGLDDDIEKLMIMSDEEFTMSLRDTFAFVDSSRKFDVLLVWDLLSFLSLEKIVILFDVLAPFICEGALCHFFAYVGTCPEHPSKFNIENERYMQVSIGAGTRSSRIPLTTASILKSLPDYSILKNFLNLKEMTSCLSEQILCYRPEGLDKPVRLPSAEIDDTESMVRRTIYSPAVSLLRENGGSHTVLDLGAKSIYNDDAWRRSYDEVVFEDIRPIIQRLNEQNPESQRRYLENSHMLNFDKNRQFDAIVVWDLLSFCNRSLLEEIGRRLVRYCKDGTLIVVMVHTGKVVPVEPISFLLTQMGIGIPSGSVLKGKERVSVPLSLFDFQKAFPGLYIKETFAVRPGMLKGLTEYVFVYKDSQTLAGEKIELKKQVIARREQLGLGAL